MKPIIAFLQIKDLTNKQYVSKLEECRSIFNKDIKVKDDQIQEMTKQLEVTKKENEEFKRNNSSAVEKYKISKQKLQQVKIVNYKCIAPSYDGCWIPLYTSWMCLVD